MKHKVSELEGALLDAAVAKANGGLDDQSVYWQERDGSVWTRVLRDHGYERLQFEPSRDWRDAGPIIEACHIHIRYGRLDDYERETDGWCAEIGGLHWQAGAATPLVAAMRAYVASKFGEEIELP
jgi:hypothetical protein